MAANGTISANFADAETFRFVWFAYRASLRRPAFIALRFITRLRAWKPSGEGALMLKMAVAAEWERV